MPKHTETEGVITVKDNEGELTAIIYKDMVSRKNIFYSCKEMSFEELGEMIGSDKVKV